MAANVSGSHLFERQLCYTRGSVIPCLMSVETTDPQALDLLSAPRSLLVRLLRQIATGEGTLRTSGGKRLPSLHFEREVHELATAVWQPYRSRQQYRRVLHGEIHVDRYHLPEDQELLEVRFVKVKGDPLEWRRFFKKIALLCKDGIYNNEA